MIILQFFEKLILQALDVIETVLIFSVDIILNLFDLLQVVYINFNKKHLALIVGVVLVKSILRLVHIRLRLKHRR